MNLYFSSAFEILFCPLFECTVQQFRAIPPGNEIQFGFLAAKKNFQLKVQGQ